MNRHALLIGSQILKLRGTHHDVDAMAKLLGERSFEVTRCIEAAASREGILTGYRDLIGRTKSADAVVVYYSGHGGYAEDRTGHRVQYILPTDWVEDDDTFHGIVDTELSALLARLTEKTPNVAVILDCCHSSLISRGVDPPPEIVARVVPGKWTRALEAHVATTPARVYIAGNPHAVRLVATEADREAFEADQDVDGKLVPRGYFTRALQRVLAEPGSAALSWRGLCNRVREQVLARVRMQRPSVEGPADRTLFTTSEQSRPDAVVYFMDTSGPALRASRLLGADVGIEYDVVRLGETAVTEGTRVATATIKRFDGSKALVTLSDIKESPSPGALAFPKKSLFPRMPTFLAGRDNPELHEKLSESMFVALGDRDIARFVVETVGDTIRLTDHADGAAYSFDLKDDFRGRRLATQWIERWAKAEALRWLPPGGLPDDAIELTWGHVVSGQLITRGYGDPFRVGEKICLYVKNTSQQALYMWVIDIGVSGKITIISGVAEGQRIIPGARLAIGENKGIPEGLELVWPSDFTPKATPRRESISVLAANHWLDVSVFETPTMRVRSHHQTNSVLEDMMRSLGTGATRDLTPYYVNQAYGVRRIDFDLDPRR